MPATAFSSITSRRSAARRSSRARSRAGSRGSRKVCRTACISGNLDSLRDWGHARDYVEGAVADAAAGAAEDFVIATGEQHSVREFVRAGRRPSSACRSNGRARASRSRASIRNSGRTIVKVDPRYFRPTEVDTLLGDASKARAEARLAGGNQLRGAGEGNGRSRSRDGAGAMRWLRARASRPSSIMNKHARDLRCRSSRPGRQRHRAAAAGGRIRRICCWRRAPSSICAIRRQSSSSSQRERPEFVFLAAAKVGGIHANDTYPADFHARQPADPDRTSSTRPIATARASCCSWVRAASIRSIAPQPMPEECLLTGPLEPTNEWYAIAKIAGLKMCQAYRRQYGFNAISRDADQPVWSRRQLRSAEFACAAGADPQFHEAKLRGDAAGGGLGHRHAATGVPARR